MFAHESLETLQPTERREHSVGLEDGMRTEGGMKYPNLCLLFKRGF